jgi:hypothetical protein
MHMGNNDGENTGWQSQDNIKMDLKYTAVL